MHLLARACPIFVLDIHAHLSSSTRLCPCVSSSEAIGIRSFRICDVNASFTLKVSVELKTEPSGDLFNSCSSAEQRDEERRAQRDEAYCVIEMYAQHCR